jgi:hypothetical protein
VTDRDRAAMHVDPLRRQRTKRLGQTELLTAVLCRLPGGETAEHLRGEGLVDFPQVDVVEGELMPLQDRRRRMHRAEPHLRRVKAGPVAVGDSAERRELPLATAASEARISHAAPSVICELLPGVTRPYLRSKKGLSLAETGQAGIGTHAVVLCVDLARTVDHRHDLAELPGRLRGERALMAAHAVFVHLLP